MFRKRPFAPDLRVGRSKLLEHCVSTLTLEGYQVFKRGWPTVAAVKNAEMRLFVINPLVDFHPVILGAGKDAMSDAFERCFGVSYEVWENPKPDEEPKSWM